MILLALFCFIKSSWISDRDNNKRSLGSNLCKAEGKVYTMWECMGEQQSRVLGACVGKKRA